MNTATAASLRANTHNRRDVAARVGGWAYVATGFGHLVIATVVSSPADVAAVEEQMRQASIAMGPTRTLAQLMTGFSLAMGVLLTAIGAVILTAARRGMLRRRDSQLSIVIALSIALLAIAVVLLPAPPIVTMTIAVAALTLAWAAPDPVGDLVNR